jgi:hypothetical protein
MVVALKKASERQGYRLTENLGPRRLQQEVDAGRCTGAPPELNRWIG